ncbi:hypothetical protein [Endozoicomonas arenosclerae]|uniref:hypothetical protein n=1 Tax=Endozoicomonas arenosclerae TaxID=1633495 RepID=UPI000786469A|nr:hypothetical protein [Endozoicomonas arenosclerae]
MPDLTNIVREKYYNNQLLEVADFDREQSFHIQHRLLQTRLMYTPGLLQGITVEARTAGISLTPGIALDASGQQILLVNSLQLDGKTITASQGQFTLDLSAQNYLNNSFYLFLQFNEVDVPNTSNQLISSPTLSLQSQQANGSGIVLGKVTLGSAQDKVSLDSSMRVQARLRSEMMPSISASQIISGTLSSDRLPELSAGLITKGVFSLEQIPDIPAGKLQKSLSLSCEKMTLENQDTATLQWQSQGIDQLDIEYVSGLKLVTLSSKDQSIALTGSHEVEPYENTTITLKGSKEGKTVVTEQLYLNVIPTAGQFIKQLIDQGVSQGQQITQCANRFKLSTLSAENVTQLGEAVKFAGYEFENALSALKTFYQSIGDSWSDTSDTKIIQNLYGIKPEASLEEFLQQQFNQQITLPVAITKAKQQFDLNLNQTTDQEKLAQALKKVGYIDWQVLQAVMSASNQASQWSSYVPIATSLSLFTPDSVAQYIQNLNQSTLIANSGQMSLIDFQKLVYQKIFLQVAQQFAPNIKEYWVYCMAIALKKQGVSQVVTGYCLTEYFKLKGWSYGFNYSLILISAYKN